MKAMLKILTKLFLALAVAACAAPAWAQQYASVTDPVTGQTKQYHIFSACPDLAYHCVQDNTHQSKLKAFLVESLDMNSELQRFEFVSVKTDTSQYYIRNASTWRYFQNASDKASLLHPVQFVALRSNTAAFTVTPIGQSGQVLISCTEEDGVTRYLCATDSSSIGQTVDVDAVQDSRFAWYIVDANLAPDAIRALPAAAARPVVNVVGRKIIVAGDPDCQLYDMQGRRLNAAEECPAGIYIVRSRGTQTKVLVK